MSTLRELLRTHENRARITPWLLVLPLVLVPTGGQTRAPARRAGASAPTARVVEGYGKLPLAFEANRGQTDAQVKFLSRSPGYSLFLTSTEAVLTLGKGSREEPSATAAKSFPGKKLPAPPEEPSVLRMKLLGASAQAEVTGQDELPGRSNYFRGNDPKKWHTNVPQYAKVRYANIYPGVDLIYYGKQRELEYDFVVQPGADPNVIRLGIEGAKDLRLEKGDLVLTSAAGHVHLRRPHIYQQANGRQAEVRGGYEIASKSEVRFHIDTYDGAKALIIDPVLAYSTYLGGTDNERSTGIAVDAMGNAYVVGTTRSPDFPTVNAIQPTRQGYSDVFVTKINADGSALVYSTYLGGGGVKHVYDQAGGIAVDSAGNAYVTGYAGLDFPTVNAIQPTNHGGYDTFVAKIDASGSALVYSTYLGGSSSEAGTGIAVDTVGNAYISGWTSSTDFPTANAIQPTNHGGYDTFVAKINASGSALVYSTYLGGSGKDSANGIAADSAGNAYVTGYTSSTNYPTANAIQSTNHGNDDAFVTKLNASGSALMYSTYLGGSGWDEGRGIAVDSSGNAYVTGGGSVENHAPGIFVTKFNAAGSALVYATYLGGSCCSLVVGIAVDAAGNAYITGFTDSTDFPTVNAIQPTKHGLLDAFVTMINASGSALVYSTYLGGWSYDEAHGIAVDSAGSAYVSGGTSSHILFPKTSLAFQQSLAGGSKGDWYLQEAFVTKIALQSFVSTLPIKVMEFRRQVIDTTSLAKTITVTNHGPNQLTINKIYIAGLNASEFAQTNNCPPTLSAAGFCSISVTFTPNAENRRKAVLGISDSDSASPQAILLYGTGTVVSLSATYLGFGRQAVGTTGAPHNVTLTNMSSGWLYFTGISITGTNAIDYSQTNTCGTSIAGGASCTITVTFTPSAIGFRKAVMSISDHGGGSPQKIGLGGTGS